MRRCDGAVYKSNVFVNRIRGVDPVPPRPPNRPPSHLYRAMVFMRENLYRYKLSVYLFTSRGYANGKDTSSLYVDKKEGNKEVHLTDNGRVPIFFSHANHVFVYSSVGILIGN